MVTVPTPLCWMIYMLMRFRSDTGPLSSNHRDTTYLVIGALRTSSDNGSIAVPLQAQGVFADVGPPDVLDGTG
jgi:hypothetical protein